MGTNPSPFYFAGVVAMCKFEPVTKSLLSVRGDDGAPTEVMVFTPIHRVGSHTVAIGATGSKEAKEYGVVFDGEMLKDHRSNTPPAPSQLQVDEKGGQVRLNGVHVKTLRV